jgi:hypothetical protein
MMTTTFKPRVWKEMGPLGTVRYDETGSNFAWRGVLGLSKEKSPLGSIRNGNY